MADSSPAARREAKRLKRKADQEIQDDRDLFPLAAQRFDTIKALARKQESPSTTQAILKEMARSEPQLRTERMSVLERLNRLETDVVISNEPTILMGKSEFRQRLIRKLRYECDGAFKQTSTGEWVSVMSPKGSSGQGASALARHGQSNDDWVAGFKTRAQWRTWLERKGLQALDDSWELLRMYDLKEKRNGQAHDAHSGFAWSINRRAELGNDQEKEFVEKNAVGFHFVYKMTWEQAIQEKKREHGRE